MKTQTMIQFHETLTEEVKQSHQDVRRHDGMKNGNVAHQGDVYCIKIPKRPKEWSTETTKESRQVALGSTTGSRHCAEGNVRVFWPESRESVAAVIDKLIPGYTAKLGRQGASVCIGPIVEADESWTLTHPEHAHHQMPPGCYLTVYQLDRRTMREVRD